MDDYAFQILQKYDREKIISPIDLDIYCNRSITDDHAENILEMLTKFCLTKNCSSIYNSTHAAVIRLFLLLGRDKDIINMLRETVKYRIFPDVFTANIFMDHFIKKDDGKSAAQMAYHLMLQEEIYPVISSSQSPTQKPISQTESLSFPLLETQSHITPYLALYSSLLNFHQNYSLTNVNKGESIDSSLNDDKILDNRNAKDNSSKNSEDEEMVYVRVPYLKRYHFDDHFDILKFDSEKADRLLLGKTLAYLGDFRVNDDYFNNIIGRSSQILGLSLWRKFDKALDILNKHLTEDTETAITKDTVDNFFCQFDNYRQEIAEIQKMEADNNSKQEMHLPVFNFDQPPKKFELSYDLDAIEKECQAVVEQLEKQKKISNFPVVDLAKSLVEDTVKLHESRDIEIQKSFFNKWIEERETNLQNQIKEHYKKRKLAEIKRAKEELEEEEKLITFFDREKEVEMLLDKADKIRDLIKRKNQPPPGHGHNFISSFEPMKD
ncbi:uncharacterized protein LOC135931914 [Gordionus sp. m RMFG-2023]|uniref:uncharacterized protein LOC135931914 n=1 Tax=Gordionus sp. m RMFG-2023 TaxID=3053472 RepID=UPI0031FBDDCD